MTFIRAEMVTRICPHPRGMSRKMEDWCPKLQALLRGRTLA